MKISFISRARVFSPKQKPQKWFDYFFSSPQFKRIFWNKSLPKFQISVHFIPYCHSNPALVRFSRSFPLRPAWSMWIQQFSSWFGEDDKKVGLYFSELILPEQQTAHAYFATINFFDVITTANFPPLGIDTEAFTWVSYRILITFYIHFNSSNNNNNHGPAGVYPPEAIWRIWRQNNGAKPTQEAFWWENCDGSASLPTQRGYILNQNHAHARVCVGVCVPLLFLGAAASPQQL